VIRIAALSSLFVLACTHQQPSPNPPPPWGVPISGGTMLITHDGAHAVIADPDRDRVMIVEVASGTTVELALQAGDEPGRLVEDAAGRVHVALRRGGALLTIANGAIAARRSACGEPRGIAYDAAADAVYLACTGGELITFPAAGGDATRVLHLDRGLRDVIVQGSSLLVTRFREAEVLLIDATGAVTSRFVPPTVQRLQMTAGCTNCGSGSPTVPAIPEVAWRAIAMPDGRALIAHQRQLDTALKEMHGGYGQGCGQGPVEDAYTLVGAPGAPTTTYAIAPFALGALPVDIAVDAAGQQIAVATAGTKVVTLAQIPALGVADDDKCGDNGDKGTTIDDQLGAPTSVAFAPTGELLVYYPELPALAIHGATTRTIVLPGPFGYDSGRALFHTSAATTIDQSGGGAVPVGAFGTVDLACASCHPEARDDGRVWTFDGVGPRRTQSLAGHILDRAPYHWTGDEIDLPTLMDDVFTNRMSGGQLTRSQHLSLGPWLDRVPAPAAPPAADAAAASRGAALFTSLACTTCHVGDLFTNHLLVDVGTGGMFKVPSLLGVGARAPYMHDGCAATLADRFGPCGGGNAHGGAGSLTTGQIADLVAYLQTL
jgi:hypothetical protein